MAKKSFTKPPKISNSQLSQEISRRQSLIRTFFSKSDGRFPYLNSAFTTERNVYNPMQTTERQNASGYYTQSSLRKMEQDRNLRSYFGGNTKYRKAAEKSAKATAKIQSNLNKSLFKATKALSNNNDSKADDIMIEALNKARANFRSKVANNVGKSSPITSMARRMIHEYNRNYFSPRIQQQMQNTKTGVVPYKAPLPTAPTNIPPMKRKK